MISILITPQPRPIACSGKGCVEDTSVAAVSFTMQDWTLPLVWSSSTIRASSQREHSAKPQEQNAYEFNLAECSQACPEGCGVFSLFSFVLVFIY